MVLGVTLAFSSPLSCETFEDIVESSVEEYDIGILEDSVPEVTEDNAHKLGIDLSIDGIEDIFNAKTVIEALFKCILSCLKETSGIIAVCCALSVFCFVIRELSSPSPAAAKVCQTVSVFTCACLLYKNVSFTVQSIKVVIDSLSGYVTATLPVTVGLMSAAGRPSFAASSGSLIYTAVGILSSVLSTFVPLLANMYFCLASMSAISDNTAFSAVSSTLKKIAVGAMTFIYFIFTGMGAVGSVATSGADSIARKGIKYAAGNYIPVAGGYISDGIDVWFASIESMRNTGGVFGIAVISITVAVPLCGMFAGYISSSICGGIFSLGGNTSAENFLKTVKDAYSLMFSFVCGYGIMLCSLFAFMMRGI